MGQFSTVRQAKDYLAGRIAAEADRQGVPLSEIERKMLYFSETDWTLPNMAQISADFDSSYDQDEYERKIAGLVRELRSRDHAQSRTDTQAWDEAVGKLSEGDHYLLVLVRIARSKSPGLNGFLPTFDRSPIRTPHDRLKLWITAFVIVVAAFGIAVAGSQTRNTKLGRLINWLFADRSHFSMVIFTAVALAFAWRIREDLKLIVKGLLKRG